MLPSFWKKFMNHELAQSLNVKRLMDEASITTHRSRTQVMRLSEAVQSPPVTSRHALNSNACIGSFYDINTDELLNEHIPFPKRSIRWHGSIKCDIVEIPSNSPVNLLKLININPAQRLSIAAGIHSAKQIAALYDYKRVINKYTRILHYSCITKTDQLTDEYFTSLMNNKPQLRKTIGTHVVVGINYGIEAVVILQLPEDDQLIAKIDRSLRRIRDAFRNGRSLEWSNEELKDLNNIHHTDIFSTISSLASFKSIL